MRFNLCVLSLAAALATSNVSFAAPLYSQDFNVDDTANWTVNPSTGANATDFVADFFYDYSLIGVPSAPNGTGTRGLKMTVNNTTGVFGGITTSPNGQSFTGNYTVSFDMWQNYAGPLGPGGNGTTQFSQYGIGTAGTASQWIGSPNTKDSVSFGTTLDGGSASDYRAYSSAANDVVSRRQCRLSRTRRRHQQQCCVLCGLHASVAHSRTSGFVSWPNWKHRCRRDSLHVAEGHDRRIGRFCQLVD